MAQEVTAQLEGECPTVGPAINGEAPIIPRPPVARRPPVHPATPFDGDQGESRATIQQHAAIERFPALERPAPGVAALPALTRHIAILGADG